jgi:hypothetical protein
MIHFATIKKEVIRNFILIGLLFFLPLCLIHQAHSQVAGQTGYNLIGTIRSGDFSGAVIVVAKGEQSFIRLFEKLPDGSQVVQVRDDSISLKGTDGTLYDMFISHEKTLGSVAPSPANISPTIPTTAATNVGPDVPVARTHRPNRHSSSEDE